MFYYDPGRYVYLPQQSETDVESDRTSESVGYNSVKRGGSRVWEKKEKKVYVQSMTSLKPGMQRPDVDDDCVNMQHSNTY